MGLQPQQPQHEGTEDGVVGHHQHAAGVLGFQGVLVALQQAMDKTAGLLHQLRQRSEGAAIRTPQFKGFGSHLPRPRLQGVALDHLLARQATPGGQIHLSQLIVQRQRGGTARRVEQGSGGVPGPGEGGAVGLGEGHLPQGHPREVGLSPTLLREGGHIVPTLNSPLQVEAAQPMAHENKAEGHSLRGSVKAKCMGPESQDRECPKTLCLFRRRGRE